MVGRVGDDPAGDRQLAALAEAGVDAGGVQRTAGVPTGTATIPVEDGTGENLIVVVPGANAALVPADADREAVRRADVVLLQFEVPIATVTAAARVAGGTVVLTPAPPQPLPAELLAAVDVLVPNEHELVALAGAPPGERSAADLARLARSLGGSAVVVTLGARGALVVPAGGPPVLQAPPPVSPVDTTGAGDCFCGALGAALAEGTDLAGAARWAVAAAALSTTGPGARGALPDAAAVRAVLPSVPAAVPVSEHPASGTGAAPTIEEGSAMTEPDDRQHAEEPAEGDTSPGNDQDVRAHTEEPAEGGDVGQPGADTPGS
jgi:ribokinase